MGWFAVTILLPCLAPLIVCLVFRLLPLPGSAQIPLLNAFKDGQLCWVAIGFCASAQYELAQRQPSPDDWAGGTLSALLVLSSLIAAGGAMFPIQNSAVRGLAWLKHYRCFVASLFVWLAASAIYSVVHYAG
jgi:hypothetical protein